MCHTLASGLNARNTARFQTRDLRFKNYPIDGWCFVKRWGIASGRPHGEYVSFYEPEGTRKEKGRYKLGSRYGTWLQWNRRGELIGYYHVDQQGKQGVLVNYLGTASRQTRYVAGAVVETRTSPPWFTENEIQGFLEKADR